MKLKIIAQNKENLKILIKEEIELNGTDCDLNHIDVSNIINMAHLFQNSQFNGNISKWNVSKVENMRNLFYKSEFNGDISEWDVSEVRNMDFMFTNSKFTHHLVHWIPLKLGRSEHIFRGCEAPIPYWSEYTYEDGDLRHQAIKKYQLSKKLHDELGNNEIFKNKPKI